jgi:hypothetical protein
MPGQFPLNQYLYDKCIRNWKVKRRYYVKDIDDKCRVAIAERKEHKDIRIALSRCKILIDKALMQGKDHVLHDDDFIAQLKGIMGSCGQSIDSFEQAAPNNSVKVAHI